MHIRSIGVAINCSFCSIFRVISISFEYFSQGLSCTQVCTTAMILKSDQGATIPVDGYISNTPRYACPFMNCPRIENSQSSHIGATGGSVIMCQQLVSATDCQHRHIILNCSPEPNTLGVMQILRYGCLFPVLASSNEQHIVLVGCEGIPQ